MYPAEKLPTASRYKSFAWLSHFLKKDRWSKNLQIYGCQLSCSPSGAIQNLRKRKKTYASSRSSLFLGCSCLQYLCPPLNCLVRCVISWLLSNRRFTSVTLVTRIKPISDGEQKTQCRYICMSLTVDSWKIKRENKRESTRKKNRGSPDDTAEKSRYRVTITLSCATPFSHRATTAPA